MAALGAASSALAPAAEPEAREVAKFKHLYGTGSKQDLTIFNLTPNVNASMEANLVAASKDFWAVPWTGGGGPVYVSSHEAFGKVEPQSIPVVNGHKAPVLSLAFSPGDGLLATGSDDQHVCLWRIPEGGLSSSLSAEDAVADLRGHAYGVRALAWHPTAPILASAAGSEEMLLWDVEAQQACGRVPVEAEGISSLSFNYEGSLVAVASRGIAARICDPRAGAPVSASPHEPSTRGQRVVWCTNFGGNSSLLSVDIASGGRGRRISLWDPRNLAKPALQSKVDTATGVLFPVYDEGTGTVLLSGRGDTTIRVYELGSNCSSLTHCSDTPITGEPMAGIAKLPTQSCNVREVETAKVLRLAQTSVQPITFVLPRSEQLKEFFQDDIFPQARAAAFAQSAADWLGGGDPPPVREELRPEGMPLLSEKPPEPKRTSNSEILKAKIDTEKAEDDQRRSVMERMQAMAAQRSQYHPNSSMGAKKGVDATPIYDSDDGGWSDEDEDE
jgi:hypothetical protein